MGSGAFLVAACRYLALACERANLEAGGPECDDDMRAAWRRRAAQRCLFGVDANPMAVQLAQLSLWLATLAPGRPLTFLDHHLLCGDSLIGASPADVMRQPPGRTAGGGYAARPRSRPFSTRLARWRPSSRCA